MNDLTFVFRSLPFGVILACFTAGCSPAFYQPNYYGPTPAAPVYPSSPQPVYPSSPQPVYPSSPQPGSPVTSNPSAPGTGPIVSTPSYPSIPATPTGPTSPSVPVSTPTNNPVPIPSKPTTPTSPSNPPSGNITAQWAPWPLPPRQGAAIAMTQRTASSTTGTVHTARKHGHRHHRHLSVATRPGSSAERVTRQEAALTTAAASAAADPAFANASDQDGQDDHQLLDGANPTPMEDLHYRGGKTMKDMAFVNLYISGEQGWNMSDVNNIDKAIAAAMTDPHLDNVIRQYFNNQPISAAPLPSHPLNGYLPKKVSRGDIQYFVDYLYKQGYLSHYDLSITCFNFLCPPGTVLTDEDARSGSAVAKSSAEREEDEITDENGNRIIGFPENEAEVDSLGGLGGYHGSIVVGNQTIYYSAEVYSESRPDGFKNGIPAFSESWKNVVATMYHELQEFRTDPDVEDVIRNPYTPNIVSRLGWTSDAGEEIGDFPLHDNVSIRKIIQEVPLADGSGTVPIQLEYSNAVHGPEGPIAQLHPTPAN